MSDYENLQRWKAQDIKETLASIEKFTLAIAEYSGYVTEFSQTNPDVAQYYRDWIVDHQQRLQYFQDLYTKLTQ